MHTKPSWKQSEHDCQSYRDSRMPCTRPVQQTAIRYCISSGGEPVIKTQATCHFSQFSGTTNTYLGCGAIKKRTYRSYTCHRLLQYVYLGDAVPGSQYAWRKLLDDRTPVTFRFMEMFRSGSLKWGGSTSSHFCVTRHLQQFCFFWQKTSRLPRPPSMESLSLSTCCELDVMLAGIQVGLGSTKDSSCHVATAGVGQLS